MGRQLEVDAANDQRAVAGDAATVQLLWDRAGHTIHTTDPNRRRAGQRRAAVPWRGGEQGEI